MRTHAPLTEGSHTHSLRAPIGKGREGKGREKEVASRTLTIKLKSPTREPSANATAPAGLGD